MCSTAIAKRSPICAKHTCICTPASSYISATDKIEWAGLQFTTSIGIICDTIRFDQRIK